MKDSTIVCVPYGVAKQITKDLLTGDSAKAMLAVTESQPFKNRKARHYGGLSFFSYSSRGTYTINDIVSFVETVLTELLNTPI